MSSYPERWETLDIISGYIDDDDIEDKIVTIKKAEPNMQESAGNDRRLLILAGQGHNTFSLLAQSNNVLPCSGCLGMMGSSGNQTAIILLENKIITIGWLSGSRSTTEVVLQFHYDADANTILLSHEELIKTDRATGETSKEVTNYSEGYTMHNGVKEPIAQSHIPIESVEFEMYQH